MPGVPLRRVRLLPDPGCSLCLARGRRELTVPRDSRRRLNVIGLWEGRGLFLYFLPPYSPELNRIELLWKKIKHEWLPLKAWKDWKTFRHEMQLVLDGIGSKCSLTYA